MEHTNFSYAKRNVFSNKYKRTKIFGMILFIMLLTMIISFLPLLSATITWNTPYTYDSFSGTTINSSLWSNTTFGTGSVTSQGGGYINASVAVGGGASSGGAAVNSTVLPSYLILSNITTSIRLHCSNFGIYAFAQFSIAGNWINETNCGGSAILDDNSTYNLIKNYTNNKFEVFDNGVHVAQITPTNSVYILYAEASTGGAPTSLAYAKTNNITYVYDNNTMNITLNSPSNISAQTVTFNISTSTSINILSNITLYIDGIINDTQVWTGTSNETIFNELLSNGTHNWSVYVCDTVNCKFSDTLIFYANPFNVTSVTYNSATYETENELFILNLTSNGLQNLTAILHYNGTNYTAINYGDNTNAVFKTYLDIPITPSITVKTFNWTVYYGSTAYPTNQYSQTINPIYFTICNSTNNITYINFTYKNEMNGSDINASIPSSNFNYWIGNGSVQKTYTYANTTEGPSSGFCFSPSNKSIYLNYIYQASSLGYITRTYNSIDNLTLSSTTTGETLYLILSTDAGPVTIQVVDLTSGNVVPNARVTITRILSGSTITVLDGYTDSAGTIATYLSSIVSYTITAQKSGCGVNIQTVTPVGSYNMQLNCASPLTPYVSDINGVTYQHSPNTGISTPGNLTFEYFVASAFTPIISVKFELYDDTNTLVGSNQTDVSSGYSWCNAANCSLTLQHYSACGDNIKGRYYINLGNTTNNTYVLLEKDAYWRYICINPANSQQAWLKAVTSFQAWMNVWGGNQTANCVIYKTKASCIADPICKWLNTTEWDPDASTNFTRQVNLCMLKDDANKAEFNRILFIFFGMVVVLFIIGKGIGYEMTNPGSFVMFMSIIILILSMGGLFTFSGLTPWEWFNQYIYAYICITISAGYNLAIIRRYSA